MKQEMQQPGGVGAGELHLIGYLISAAFRGDLYEVRRLVEHRPGLVDARDRHGCTALRAACLRGYCEVVTYLLDQGADINEKVEGISLLYSALCCNSMAVFNLLLERGADPLMVDDDGYNILTIVSSGGNVNAMATLLNLQRVRDAVNTKAASGITPLFLAAFEGHSEIVKLLLGAGADPHLGHCSCVEVAKSKGYPECIRLFEVSSHYDMCPMPRPIATRLCVRADICQSTVSSHVCVFVCLSYR